MPCDHTQCLHLDLRFLAKDHKTECGKRLLLCWRKSMLNKVNCGSVYDDYLLARFRPGDWCGYHYAHPATTALFWVCGQEERYATPSHSPGLAPFLEQRDRPGHHPPFLSVIVNYGIEAKTTDSQASSPTKEAQRWNNSRHTLASRAGMLAGAPCGDEGGAGLPPGRSGRCDPDHHCFSVAWIQLGVAYVPKTDRDLLSLRPIP